MSAICSLCFLFVLTAKSLKEFGTDANDIRFQPNTVGAGVSGIIQIRYSGQWGTVCCDGWDMKDTVVACRQLGYARGVGFWKYGTGQGLVWLNEVDCTGSETSLDNCTHPGWGVDKEDCMKHIFDVGVVCSSYTGSANKNMTLRFQPDTLGSGVAGILQVYLDHQWGTVCHKPFKWDITDTTVACKQLGFSKAIGFWHEARGEGKVLMNNVKCTGPEKTLQSCTHNRKVPKACKGHRYDVGIICSGYNVRLVGGSEPNEGRIQVMQKGTWGSVCGDYDWSLENSNVICRMLGYKRAITNKRFGEGGDSQPILLQEVRCKGCEMSIAECQTTNYSLSKCTHRNDVGVVCLPKGQPNIRIRLINDDDKKHVGQVKIRYHGIWRTICANNWGMRDAHVICKMLGYQKAVDATRIQPGVADRVWLADVDCTGNETSIEDCKNLVWNWESKPCSTSMRAGVICQTEKVSDGLDFRIVERINDRAGRLALKYYSMTWKGLCIDSLDLNAAHVICRMLKHPKAVTIYPWGKLDGKGYSLSMRCDGSENSAYKCKDFNLIEVDNCGNNDVAGIVCALKTASSEKEEIRLVEGSSALEGRVEVQRHGVLGTICSAGWDMSNANVVCRMKGYTGAITAYKKFPEGSGPIWMSGWKCKGYENSTFDCEKDEQDKTKLCSQRNEAGVVCYSEKGYLQVSLELNNTTSLYEGRVKIKVNNETGTISGEEWDIQDAHVVCRTLGFSNALAAIGLLREETDKVLFSKVRCNGTEKSLELCQHGGWGTGSQNHSYDAGVICEKVEVEAKAMVSSDSNKGAVVGLSILIVILIMVMAGAFVWYFFKLRNQKNNFSDKTQGLAMERQADRSTVDDVTDDYYQAPPSRDDQNRYISNQASDRSARHARGRNARRNVEESEESSMYLEVRR